MDPQVACKARPAYSWLWAGASGDDPSKLCQTIVLERPCNSAPAGSSHNLSAARLTWELGWRHSHLYLQKFQKGLILGSSPLIAAVCQEFRRSKDPSANPEIQKGSDTQLQPLSHTPLVLLLVRGSVEDSSICTPKRS